MDVTPLAEAKDGDVSLVLEEMGSTGAVKKRRQRRVSFANTKTIHVIPRNDDFGISPDPLPQQEDLSSQPSTPTNDSHDDDDEDAPSDMDTSGSFNTVMSAGTEAEAEAEAERAPVFLWHINCDEESDANVDEDTTLDARTLSRHLYEASDTNSKSSVLSKQDETCTQSFCSSKEFIGSEKCHSPSLVLNPNCTSLVTDMSFTKFSAPVLPNESDQTTGFALEDPSDMSIMTGRSKAKNDKLVSYFDGVSQESCFQLDGLEKKDSSPKQKTLSNLLNFRSHTSESYSLPRHLKKGRRLSYVQGKENMSPQKGQIRVYSQMKKNCDGIKSVCSTRTEPLVDLKELADKSNNGSDASSLEDMTITVPSLSDMLAADPDSTNPMFTNSNPISISQSAKVVDVNNSPSHMYRLLQNEDMTVVAPRIRDILAADSPSLFFTPSNAKRNLNLRSSLLSTSPLKQGFGKKKTLHIERNAKSNELLFPSDESMEVDKINDVASFIGKTNGKQQFDSSFNVKTSLSQVNEKCFLRTHENTKSRSEILKSACIESSLREYPTEVCDSEALVEMASKKASQENGDSMISLLQNIAGQCDRELALESSFLQPRLSCTSSSYSFDKSSAGNLWQGLSKSLAGVYMQGSSLKQRCSATIQGINADEPVMQEEVLDSSYNRSVPSKLFISKSQGKQDNSLKLVPMLHKSPSSPINCRGDFHIPVKEIIDLLTEKRSVIMEQLQPLNWDGIVPAITAKPQTIQEHLIFSCLSRPQIEIFLEYKELLRKHIECRNQNNAELRASISKSESIDALSIKSLQNKHLLNLQQLYEWYYRLGSKRWQIYLNIHIRDVYNCLEECVCFLTESTNDIKSYIPDFARLHGDALRFLSKLSLLDASCNLKGKKTSQMADQHTHLSEAQDKLMKSSEKLVEAKKRLETLKSKLYDVIKRCRKKPEVVNEDDDIDTVKSDASDVVMKNYILQESQLMEVKMARNQAQRKVIELNCYDLVVQRFEYIENGLAAEVHMSIINCPTIEMMFPFMNAKAAFENVVSCLLNKAVIQLNDVPLVIQKTNWLLGSLIDILLELKDCCRVFQTSARFLFAGGAGDQLQVTFLVLYSAMKVVISFEIDWIKRGVYPRDLLPSNVEVQYAGGIRKGAITAASLQAKMSSVKPGFDRIKRICACVYSSIRSKPITNK